MHVVFTIHNHECKCEDAWYVALRPRGNNVFLSHNYTTPLQQIAQLEQYLTPVQRRTGFLS